MHKDTLKELRAMECQTVHLPIRQAPGRTYLGVVSVGENFLVSGRILSWRFCKEWWGNDSPWH